MTFQFRTALCILSQPDSNTTPTRNNSTNNDDNNINRTSKSSGGSSSNLTHHDNADDVDVDFDDNGNDSNLMARSLQNTKATNRSRGNMQKKTSANSRCRT